MSAVALTRRDVLKRGAVLGAALSGWGMLTRTAGGPAAAQAATLPPFSLPLRFPTVITDPDVTLTVAETDVQVFPAGPPTKMWTFGGEFPGPVIRRSGGATTSVTFDHQLPTKDTLTIHHHGHHSLPRYDGRPDEYLIAPGSTETYVYDHVEEGKPLRAAMRWYHDHSHGLTGLHSWKGLVGLFVTDDDVDGSLNLPAGDRELLLVCAERDFDSNNQLTDPFTDAPAPPSDDSVGIGLQQNERMLVNGVPEPYHPVDPVRYRLRILNASAFHPLNIQFDRGLSFWHIGTESGLLPSPNLTSSLLLGPAERADIVVDFANYAGQNVVLRSAPQQAGIIPGTAAADYDLVQFRVGALAVADASSLPPATLRALPAWTAGVTQTPDRVFAFGIGADPSGSTAWTINGRTYDPTRVDARPELGSTESWLLVNTSTTSHYIHIHDVDWLVVSRNGQAPGPDEAGLKETFRLDPGGVVVIAAKFTDHLGQFMVHCHMLNHEDHAMMTQFEVVPAGQGDKPPVTDSTPARVAGRRVQAPLGGLTGQEAARVRRMLAAQTRRPGHAATPPAAPLRLAATEMRHAFECRLPVR
jgi:spore coat protein A